MATAATWTDTTSYSRDEHGTVEPSEWTWKGADPLAKIEVSIHRRIDHPPTAWFLSCDRIGARNVPLGRPREVLSVADAQYAALRYVEELLDRMSGDVRKAMGE